MSYVIHWWGSGPKRMFFSIYMCIYRRHTPLLFLLFVFIFFFHFMTFLLCLTWLLKQTIKAFLSQFRIPQSVELTCCTICCPSHSSETWQSLSISIFSLPPLSTEYREIKLKDHLWKPCKWKPHWISLCHAYNKGKI